MNDDGMRRILQLERRVQDLVSEIEAIRNRKRNIPMPGSRVAILQPSATINGMTESAGVYTVTHGNAIIFDLITRNTGSTYQMKQVEGDTVRYVKLANVGFDPLLAGEFLFGLSHNGIYVPLLSAGVRVFVAELTSNWTSNTADCEIYSMNGNTLTLVEAESGVFDPLGAFSVLQSGDRLYVTKQGDSYYAVNNAPCPA